MRPTETARQVHRLDEHPVRHDLVLGLRRDQELPRCLVGGMIDHRQPVSGAVEPVLAECRPVAVDGVDNQQSTVGHAVVADGKGHVLPGRRLRRYRQVQPIVAVLERHRGAAGSHAGHVHPLAIRRGRGQVQDRLTGSRSGDSQGDGDLGLNLVRVPGQQRQANGVVTGIDTWLSRVGVGRERPGGPDDRGCGGKRNQLLMQATVMHAG